MAETAESLYRRGAISSKQASKLGILKKTKVERPNEEAFDGKQGRRDQGGHKDRGHKIATTKHIDGPDQGMGMGAPSKGGAAGKSGQVRANEINDSQNQRPEFPRAGGSTRPSSGGSAKNGKGAPPMTDDIDQRDDQRPSFPKQGRGKNAPMNPRSKGKIAKTGGQYGGGGRNTQ